MVLQGRLQSNWKIFFERGEGGSFQILPRAEILISSQIPGRDVMVRNPRQDPTGTDRNTRTDRQMNLSRFQAGYYRGLSIINY